MGRKYKQVKEKGAKILELREQGKTWKETGEELGLTAKEVKDFICRHNRARKNAEQGIIAGPRGGHRKKALSTEEEKDNEIQRLRMENELLRDFLRLAGRR